MSKVLYIGQIDTGGTCFDRMNSLKRSGLCVSGFNTSKYQSDNRIVRSIQWRLKPGLLLKKLNIDLIEYARKIDHVDLIWIDKGVWIFPETVASLKDLHSAKTVHFTPDPQILFHKSNHFISSIPVYDYLVTTKSFEVGLYRKYGARNVIMSQQSFCPERYKSPVRTLQYECDIGFIGHYETHYGRRLARLAECTSNMKIFGTNWKSRSWRHRGLSSAVKSDGVWQESYINALASFKIGVGLLSKWIPEQHTTRTFEIPAAGTFLLAERTQEHLSFFEEGIEAEFFSSDEEMVDKARFYLANGTAREKIANAGHRRCLASGYDNDSVVRRILDEIGMSKE